MVRNASIEVVSCKRTTTQFAANLKSRGSKVVSYKRTAVRYPVCGRKIKDTIRSQDAVSVLANDVELVVDYSNKH